MVFEVGIGTSQNWDPEKAAEEVITQALSKLSKPPSFVLLFSTIHYEKNKGFQKILNKIYTKIPKETPLVGGTVAGFMNNDGCYVRGLTSIICYCDEVEFTTGVGYDTKRNPKKAAVDFIKMIKENEQKKNNVCITLISGAKASLFPFRRRRVINIPFDFFIPFLLKFTTKLIQQGVARAKDVLEEVSKNLPNYYIIGGETTDDNNIENNFQFINQKVISNSIVGLKLSTNSTIKLERSLNVTSSNKPFTLNKKEAWGHLISKINNKSARKALLEILRWPEKDLTEHVYRRIFFYPLAFKKSEKLMPVIIGAFWGKYICLEYPVESESIEFPNYSIKSIINGVNSVLGKIQKNKNGFIFGTSCSATLEALGKKTYFIQKKLCDLESPFIVIYTGGEDIKLLNEPPLHTNYSFNILKVGS